tara:strand:- start:5694 stop:6023 length:330 start_codon:yes stop_codon:yes gene_type:complete
VLTELEKIPSKHLSPYNKAALKELKGRKPNLTSKQSSLLGAFYRLDRERDRVGQMATPQHLKQSAIREYIKYNGAHSYESDIFMSIILDIDEEYLTLFFAKQKRDAKNG